MKAKRSVVYFVSQGGNGPIKIGVATDVQARLRSLQPANPYPLVLLATISGDHRREAALHRRFRKARMSGEWFAPAPELLAFIASLDRFRKTDERVRRVQDSVDIFGVPTPAWEATLLALN